MDAKTQSDNPRMQEFINFEVLVNWVQMLRANIDGAIVLADDEEESRFYERLIHPSARIIPAYNVACALLERVADMGIEGVIATARRTSYADLPDSVFCPTPGDVASLLLNSGGCQRVISDVCGAAWIQAGEKEVGPILTQVVNLARLFSQLRLMVEESGKSLTIQEFIKALDWKTLKIEPVNLQTFSKDTGLAAKAEDLIDSLAPTTVKEGLLDCDGMDAVYILAAATHFFKPRGISTARKIEAIDLLGLLRASYELNELENDEVFWLMKKWERQNSKYPLLDDWRTLDSLEVVWDQRYWQRDLEQYLQMLASGELLGVLKMDLDNFKIVNDELGHSAGDDAIRHYCSVAKSVVGSRGYVYRRGGDEIVVLLPDSDGYAAQAIAEEIRGQIESTFRSWAAERGLTKSPTASIGLVVSGARSLLEVVELVDKAQGEAKNGGKNRVVFAAL